MLIIIGYVVMFATIFGAYSVHGDLLALWQPLEIVMIFGGAVGAFISSNTSKVLKATMKALGQSFKGSKFTKQLYLDQLSLLYEILNRIRREGLMSIEGDIDEPEQSAMFQKYPNLLSDHHFVEFLTDYLRLMVSGNLNPIEVETLMDQELDTHHHEAHEPHHAVQRMADGLPAFGIVAAVMGVVNVMGSVGEPPEVLGGLLGAALVGTFLGILFAYGLVGPLAIVLQQKADEAGKQIECTKVVLLASLNGYAPSLAIEFGRKILFSTDRPTFMELEDAVKGRK